MDPQQPSLTLDDARPLVPPLAPSRALPVVGDALGEQKDIVYFDASPRSVLNSPAATGIGFWSLNPYVGCAFGCAYCYARYAHRYTMERTGGLRSALRIADPTAVASAAATGAGASDGVEVMGDAVVGSAERTAGELLPPWLAFERRVLVKRAAPALVRQALGGRSTRYRRLLSGEETIVVGTATDPYQPAERRFRVTRGVMEALAEHEGLRVVIITKSPLVTRDVDVLARIAARSHLSVHVSLITLDRTLARRIEPRSPTPEARLRAIARLAAAGIDVGINIMPVLPGITDDPTALSALVGQAARAGASHVGAAALRLQPAARDRYLPWIEEEFPELARRYRTSYARGVHAGERYRAGLKACMERICGRHGIRVRTYGSDDDEDDDEPTPMQPTIPSPQLGLEL